MSETGTTATDSGIAEAMVLFYPHHERFGRARGAPASAPKEGGPMKSASQRYAFSAHPQRRLRASPSVISTVGATGATAILDAAKSQFYSLNDVGGRIWSMLREGTTFTAIVEQLRREYDVSAEMLTADTEALLRQLADAELLEVDEVWYGAH